jgi:hypothetical protein
MPATSTVSTRLDPADLALIQSLADLPGQAQPPAPISSHNFRISTAIYQRLIAELQSR